MKKWLSKFKKDERGLTLVELLAVVVILAIVGLIAFVSIGNVIENSKKDAHVANAQQLISAAKLAEASHDFPEGGFYTEGFYGTAPSNTIKLDTIEELVNPWDSTDNTYAGLVKKVEGEYQVTIKGKEDTIKLNITDAPESKISEGRKEFE